MPELKKDDLGGTDAEGRFQVSGGVIKRAKFDSNQEYAYLNESVVLAIGEGLRVVLKCQLLQIHLPTLTFETRKILPDRYVEVFKNQEDTIEFCCQIQEFFHLSEIMSIQKVTRS